MLRTRNRARHGHPTTALHQRQCRLCHGTGLSAPPFDIDALLEAIVAHVDVDTFNTRDLMKSAKVHGSLLQVAVGNMTAKQLGKALRAISDMGNLGGVFIERQGKDKHGALWRVGFLAR
jgi:hypothetical protein